MFIDENFDIKNGIVGQIGHGYIGTAVQKLFDQVFTVLVYDKFKTGKEYSSLDEVVTKAHVIFVAVPTPMKLTGECHTEFVESVLQDVQNCAVKNGRSTEEFVVVIKSTVTPGFTKRMNDKYALRIVFSPEFLTEANSVQDFQKVNRVILGGELEDALVVSKFFEEVWPTRIIRNYVNHPDGPVAIVNCSSTAAEMVKLSTNAHLMSKVVLSNELYLVCKELGVNYDEVRTLTSLDPRIGASHMMVPGPDGKFGAGGHCFPKDINNLRYVAAQLGISEKMFSAIHERNLEVRDDHDWENMKGRAVIDE